MSSITSPRAIGAALALGLASFLVFSPAEADSGKSTVVAVIEAEDTLAERGVLRVIGNKVSKFKTIELRDAEGADAGVVTLLDKSSSQLSIALPVDLDPGSYTLVLSPKKGDACLAAFTYRQTYRLAGNDFDSTIGHGIVGTTSAPVASGVRGVNTTSTGFTSGITGVTMSTEGTGVLGLVQGASAGWGVIGRGGLGGVGVQGEDNALSGGGTGLFGLSQSEGGTGIWARTTGLFATTLRCDHDGAAGNIAVFRAGGVEQARIDTVGRGFFNSGMTLGGGLEVSTDTSNIALTVTNDGTGILSVGNGFSPTAIDIAAQGGAGRLNINGPYFGNVTVEVSAADNDDDILSCQTFEGDSVLLVEQDGMGLFVGDALKPGGGEWGVISDARLKKDIEDVEGALERLGALRSVEFAYKHPEAIGQVAGRQTGFIAQEVEEVFPDWVGERDGFKYVAPKGATALVVAALRELRAEKDAQINALAAENAELRRQLDETRLAHDARLSAIEAALSTRTGPAETTPGDER